MAKALSSPETLDAFNPLISDICLARCDLNEITASLDITPQIQNTYVQLTLASQVETQIDLIL